MKKKLNIFLINSKGPGGGGAHQAIQLLTKIQERGHNVVLGARKNIGWEEECGKRRITFRPLPLRHILDYPSIKQIASLCRNENIDIVQVQKGREFALSLMALYRLPNVGLVVYRGVSFPLDRFNRLKYKLGRVDAIIAVSEDIKRRLVEAGVKSDKVEVIYGGVDLDRFSRAKTRGESIIKEFLVLSSIPIILKIAHLREWKGHRTLLEALHILKSNGFDFRCFCIGRTYEPLLLELKQKASELSLSDNIIFTGERPDVPDFLATATVSVNCAYAGEGLTGALRESLAMAVPVVGTDVGGNREIILHQKTGLLCEPQNPEQIADALLALISQPELREKLGKNGQHLVFEKFSLQSQLDNLETLYYSIYDKKS